MASASKHLAWKDVMFSVKVRFKSDSTPNATWEVFRIENELHVTLASGPVSLWKFSAGELGDVVGELFVIYPAITYVFITPAILE